ncbi:hypothetical protein HYW43_00235 [Candidatus Daviesbacteria bacterium]|nr:hypothetical protein [Candidatus Daviesbacteria bacterium]
MKYLLPRFDPITILSRFYFRLAKARFSYQSLKTRFPSSVYQKVEDFLASKTGRYKLVTVLDLILIIIILISGRQSAQRMVPPLIASMKTTPSMIEQAMVPTKTTQEVFAFAPGLAQNKFDDIDFSGLNILSFFDVPLTEEGEINTESRGYSSFKSEASYNLFNQAHAYGTKVFVTLTLGEETSIRYLLDDKSAQQRLFDQAIWEVTDSQIDGVTVDFEIAAGRGQDYQNKFSEFIKSFTMALHEADPNLKLAVAVPNSAVNSEGIYAIKNLSNLADRVFLVADDFIVPEVTGTYPSKPVYGYNDNQWWFDLSSHLNNFLRKIPSVKLVLERAWYGNGYRYPLYHPGQSSSTDNGTAQDSNSVVLNQGTVERLVADVPDKGKQAARENIPLIAKALDEEGILDSNVLAYALATVEHETAETFAPIDEIQGKKSARRLGYEGGTNFHGRGFIQITHLRNYKVIGERIGMGDELAKNPKLASNPEVAAKILAVFFKDNNVANLASQGDFVSARDPINPDVNAWSVAQLAMKYWSDQ